MTNENKPTNSLIASIKSNWVSILAICAAIATVINFYWQADEYIVSRTKEAIKIEIDAYHKMSEAEQDSIIANIDGSYFKPLENEVKLNSFFINKSIQGLNAQFDKYTYRGVTLYKSKPNESGYSVYWYIFERNNRWEIHLCTYNATCDCFEYYDPIEKRKKKITRL